jgi:type I restriction enzyme S subunit
MGAAQENISQQIIKSIEIEIPSESLLQLFGKRLSEKYNLIKSLHTQNQLLKEARDILLPRLMTGMIDTDNMDIAV